VETKLNIRSCHCRCHCSWLGSSARIFKTEYIGSIQLVLHYLRVSLNWMILQAVSGAWISNPTELYTLPYHGYLGLSLAQRRSRVLLSVSTGEVLVIELGAYNQRRGCLVVNEGIWAHASGSKGMRRVGLASAVRVATINADFAFSDASAAQGLCGLHALRVCLLNHVLDFASDASVHGRLSGHERPCAYNWVLLGICGLSS